MIITGPNASGKTTLLKTNTINVVMCQQFGVGFFERGSIRPYTHIHSYLNIPDTSERDSLFQAESRRCKEIIDSIQQYPAEKGYRHYCIFDELYSGTNPVEAAKAAYAFLKYTAKFSHVDFILTTHYTSVCNKLKKSKQISNYKMNVKEKGDKMVYTYTLKKGISKIQGAVSILEDMNYPEEIVRSVKSNTQGEDDDICNDFS
jgi:DNA mismatch repair ATPase MutS